MSEALTAAERKALDEIIGPDARGAYRQAEDVWVAARAFRMEAQDGLIGRVRNALRPLGYAVAVHGSRARDLDLIAVPWAEDAAPREAILDAIEEAGFIYGPDNPKPHGRVGWQVHGVPVEAGIKYIDLSVVLPAGLDARGPAGNDECEPRKGRDR